MGSPQKAIPVPAPRPKDLRRIFSKIKIVDSGCWEWQGTWRSDGYSNFGIGGRNYYVHRLMYDWLRDEIRNGWVIDHLCRNLKCVNPFHLEPVTSAENLRRSPLTPAGQTHCKRGHAFTEENTIRRSSPSAPKRRCKTCYQAQLRRVRDARRKAKMFEASIF